MEYCGFLEYLRQLGERPSLVVETTQAKQSDGSFFQSTAVIPADQIVALGLLDVAQDLSVEIRKNEQSLWEELREENAPLRIIDQDLRLKSAPLSYYDGMLLSFVTADWIPMARIVGMVLIAISETGISPTSDLLLFSRLNALIDAGLVEERASSRRHPDIRLVGV